MKKCSICELEKPLIKFTKDKQSKDGRGSRCKDCYNAYKRENNYNSYARRAKYLLKYQRRLRKRPRHKKRQRDYRARYKVTLAGFITGILCAARTRAKANKLNFDLDRVWMMDKLRPMKCEVSGVDLTLEKNTEVFHSPFRPSLDRIDNNKGYTKQNCRIVAVIYNKAKSDYSDEDVLKMARGMVTMQCMTSCFVTTA